MRTRILLVATALIGGATRAFAETSHTGHSSGLDHSAHGQVQATIGNELIEPVQGAFAALSEVVRVLEADPETDWSQVDLTGLRAQLVDMGRLISDAAAKETSRPNGIIATATGDAEITATLLRMVPARAAQLARVVRWTVTASETEEGVALRVTSDNPAVVARIKGFGFYGLMASQDHHRAHHLMMALG